MPTREFAELQDAFDLMLRRFNDTRSALDGQMAEERRMREELQSLQRQVIRQERLAAVGQLVSGVAHEINNPLQAILGFAELLQMQADVPESIKGDLRLIQKESARACNIIRNLAMFARQQPGEAAPLRLVDVISSVAELRQRRLQSEQIELRIEDRSTLYVSAVVTELQQVLLNFVVNAEQAILASGRLPGRITIRACDIDGRILLEVEDTGPGIPPDNEAKLFQPFFTTKPVGQGTGLGLSISYGIIDSLRRTYRLSQRVRRRRHLLLRTSSGVRRSGVTSRLYYTDPYCRQFDAAVTTASLHDGRPAVVLDRTAFYPTSGGQPFDTGKLFWADEAGRAGQDSGSGADPMGPRSTSSTRSTLMTM
jgi:signal transduction histidine kinase